MAHANQLVTCAKSLERFRIRTSSKRPSYIVCKVWALLKLSQEIPQNQDVDGVLVVSYSSWHSCGTWSGVYLGLYEKSCAKPQEIPRDPCLLRSKPTNQFRMCHPFRLDCLARQVSCHSQRLQLSDEWLRVQLPETRSLETVGSSRINGTEVVRCARNGSCDFRWLLVLVTMLGSQFMAMEFVIWYHVAAYHVFLIALGITVV